MPSTAPTEAEAAAALVAMSRWVDDALSDRIQV